MTAQIPEKLIFEGEKVSMSFCPPLPKSHHRVIELDDLERMDSDLISSTACWRRYIGTWEIKNGYFYLVHLQGQYKMINTEPIFADWFSGEIEIPQGKLLEYVHREFGSVYEQEIHVVIKSGKVIRSYLIDHTKSIQNISEIQLGKLANSKRDVILKRISQLEAKFIKIRKFSEEIRELSRSALEDLSIIKDQVQAGENNDIDDQLPFFTEEDFNVDYELALLRSQFENL